MGLDLGVARVLGLWEPEFGFNLGVVRSADPKRAYGTQNVGQQGLLHVL